MLHITKIKPMFTNIIVTSDRFEQDDITNGVITAKKGDLKLWQTVVAIGSAVRDVNVGDKVMINVQNFAVKRYDKNSLQNDIDNNPILSYKFNWVSIDNAQGKAEDYLLINDRDILYSFEGSETSVDIVTDTPKIIV